MRSLRADPGRKVTGIWNLLQAVQQPFGRRWYPATMRTLAAILFALVLAAPAVASCNLSSVRLSAGLVKIGDTERRRFTASPDCARPARGRSVRRDCELTGYGSTIPPTRVCRVRD